MHDSRERSPQKGMVIGLQMAELTATCEVEGPLQGGPGLHAINARVPSRDAAWFAHSGGDKYV